MEKEELRKIIRETLEEFFKQHREEWEEYYYRWVRRCREEKLSPPPGYLVPLLPKEEINEFRKITSTLYKISKGYEAFLMKLESWDTKCSEKEKIEVIKTSVKNIENSVDSIKKILSKISVEKSKG